MKTTRFSLSYICKGLTWSSNERRAAMPACPAHDTDRQGCGFARLPIHATENRP
jgi:hypothetical protein